MIDSSLRKDTWHLCFHPVSCFPPRPLCPLRLSVFGRLDRRRIISRANSFVRFSRSCLFIVDAPIRNTQSAFRNCLCCPCFLSGCRIKSGMTKYIVIPANPGSGSRAGAGIQRSSSSTLVITVFRPWTLDIGLVLSYSSLIAAISGQLSARDSLLNQSTNLVLNCFTQRTQ